MEAQEGSQAAHDTGTSIHYKHLYTPNRRRESPATQKHPQAGMGPHYSTSFQLQLKPVSLATPLRYQEGHLLAARMPCTLATDVECTLPPRHDSSLCHSSHLDEVACDVTASNVQPSGQMGKGKPLVNRTNVSDTIA